MDESASETRALANDPDAVDPWTIDPKRLELIELQMSPARRGERGFAHVACCGNSLSGFRPRSSTGGVLYYLGARTHVVPVTGVHTAGLAVQGRF